jgi:hypothetical protein
MEDINGRRRFDSGFGARTTVDGESEWRKVVGGGMKEKAANNEENGNLILFSISRYNFWSWVSFPTLVFQSPAAA